MIGSALSRLDTAEKLSIPQLQQAIQSGTIPAYMGVPLLEEKIAFEQRMRSAAAARMAQGQQPTIAEQVMDQAQMVDQQMMDEGGIDQLPIEAPEFAGGGIVAFEDGGQVQRFQNQGLALPTQTALRVREMMTPDEKKAFDTTGTIPERLRPQIGLQTPDLRAPVRMIDGRPVPIDVKTGKELGIAPDMEEKPSAPDIAGIGAPRGMGSIIGEATRMTDALGLGPKEGERVPTIEEASKQTSDLFAKSGYDEGLLKRMGQDIAKQREGLEADRSEAKAYRLIEAGLGIMSGTSANAFENIGKGATPALKGLASDIKEIKKAEREYQLAEQNLLLKQNEAAMGKAKITQSTIDKAQDRLDKKAETYERTRADLAKTLVSGEIQKDVARSTVGARMTDFDKKWSLAEAEAKRLGVPLTPQFFAQMWSVGAGTMTREEAVTKVLSTDYGKQLDLSDPKDKQKLQEQVDYLLGVGSPRAASSATGKPPALPPGFVLQQ
jgi:hypothetical protein